MAPSWPPAPQRPPRAAPELHVWRAGLDPIEGSELGRDELLAHRRRTGASVLREVLARYLDCERESVALALGPRGKPKLVGEGPYFNLTHTEGLMLVAVHAEREVGVDAEVIEPDRDVDSLSRIGLPADLQEAVAAAPPAQRSQLFHVLWTRHEALVKCHGTGLATDTPMDPVWIAPLAVGPGIAAAVALAGEDPPAGVLGWSL